MLKMYGNFTTLNSTDTLCHFHCTDFALVSTVINATAHLITCITPPVQFTAFTFPVISRLDLINAKDIGRVPLTRKAPFFTFYPQSALRNLYPAYGSEFGGTDVTIIGRFTRSNELICKFGELLSPFAQWINKDTIRCTTPPATRNFLISPVVSVTVLTNGEDDEGLSLPFRYLSASHISSIHPRFGSISGGTLVFIELRCTPGG